MSEATIAAFISQKVPNLIQFRGTAVCLLTSHETNRESHTWNQFTDDHDNRRFLLRL